MKTRVKLLAREMAAELRIPRESIDLFVDRVQNLVAELIVDQPEIPEKPSREFQPYRDKIVDYLRADDGFGPWLKAGLLTRPLIREKSTAAYTALNYYLRNHDLPSDIHIPTRQEVIAQRDEEVAQGVDAEEGAREAEKRARLLRRVLNKGQGAVR